MTTKEIALTYVQVLAIQARFENSIKTSGIRTCGKSIGFDKKGRYALNVYLPDSKIADSLPDSFEGVTVIKEIPSTSP